MDKRDTREEMRQQRLEAERTEAELARRRLIAGYFVAGLLFVGILGGVAALIASGGDEESSVPSGDPFAPQYGGLEARRLEAGVPTMSEGGGEHFHPEITVYANDEQVTVPANIGVDPARPPQMMAGLHTHDESGTIHNEAGSGSTLGQFFAIWGVPFSAERLGPYEASGSKQVRLWVDGEPSDAYGDLELVDGQRIAVAYGTEKQLPPGVKEP